MPDPASNYRFGPYELHVRTRELFKNGSKLKLRRQPFQILQRLVECAPEVVSREELRHDLWSSGTFVDFEHGLNTSIKELRAALNDSATQPKYIQTLPKLGYRMVVSVEVEAILTAAPRQARPINSSLEDSAVGLAVHVLRVPPDGSPEDQEREESSPRRNITGRRAMTVATVLGLLIAIGWGGSRWWRSSTGKIVQNSAAPDARSMDLYQKGRLFWNKRTPAGFREGLGYFQQAIGIDPRNARAYSGVADTYALMSGYGLGPPDELMPKARAAALKAIELDANLAEAHASWAVISQNYDWDWQTAEEQYRLAIRLDPNYATAHQWYAECLALQGQFPQAMNEIDTARRLDSASLIIAADRGAILYFAREYELAIEQFQAVLTVEPYMPRAFMISWAYLEQGKPNEAKTEKQKWERIGNAPWAWVFEAGVAARNRDMAAAKAAVQKVQEFSKPESDPIPLLQVYATVGDKDKAFEYLDLAFRRHANSLNALKVDPVYDPLRDDPRFNAYLSRLGLVP